MSINILTAKLNNKKLPLPAARGPCSSGARASGPFGPWLRRHCILVHVYLVYYCISLVVPCHGFRCRLHARTQCSKHGLTSVFYNQGRPVRVFACCVIESWSKKGDDTKRKLRKYCQSNKNRGTFIDYEKIRDFFI